MQRSPSHHHLSLSQQAVKQAMRSAHNDRALNEPKPGGNSFLEHALFIIYSMPRAFGLVWGAARVYATATGILTIINGFIPTAQLYIGKLIIDAIQASTAGQAPMNTTYVFQLLALEFGLVIGSETMTRLNGYIQGIVGDLISHSINNLILEKATTLDLETFENATFYNQLQNAQREATIRPISLVNQVFGIFQNTITFASLLVLMLRFNPWIMLLLFVSVVPNLFIQSKVAEWVYLQQKARVAINRQLQYLSTLLTSDTTAKEIKLYRLGNYFLDKYKSYFGKVYNENRQLDRRQSFMGISLSVISNIAFYLSYAYIVLQAVQGRITLGDLTLYVGIFRSSQSLLRSLLLSFSGLYEGNLYLSNLYSFLDLEPDIDKGDTSLQPAPTTLKQGIEFRHVWFKYPNGRDWVHKDLNFHIKPGETIALIGENGAGKTTLIKMLTRLYDPTEGQILVDGVDLREIDPHSWRSNIGVIFQDYVQYQMTARENIGLGKTDSIDDFDRVRQAAQASGADQVIGKLPLRYESILGKWFDGGQQLSGGQWQKIAISRGFMRDAPILILDEPTAAIDARAEHEFFQRMKTLAEGKTTFLITHRFSTVKIADRIIVIENGKLAEQGTHRELMTLNGVYANFYKLQAQGFQQDDDTATAAPASASVATAAAAGGGE
ncbi:MAG: ABC transporter ATP-binding protein [Anaerolineae bacterium]|nr:ABC transporter ATP-binding protein [Anaerolineae bacterium]